jgi:acyl carrier protein
MDITQFCNLVAQQFNDTPASSFAADTRFRELAEWDSLIALSVIAAIDEECKKTISGSDIREVNTIQELYDLVQAK